MVYDIGTLLAQFQSYGVFDYLLPFLLIFAIIFGILTATGMLGGNKGIHILIAVVTALLALQLDFVPAFFREIFPRLGVGLAVIMVIVVLVGLFIPLDERRFWGWGLGTIGFIVAIIAISKAFSQYGWYSYGTFDDYVGWVVGAVLVIGLIIAIANAGPKNPADVNPNKYKPEYKSAWGP
ncbi:hypothetical protein HYZ97_03805 [Candidatus Pacearchaeota archaeon]|nr:hypothetical protein [Candidatus Pacearchaeota archaeon]